MALQRFDEFSDGDPPGTKDAPALGNWQGTILPGAFTFNDRAAPFSPDPGKSNGLGGPDERAARNFLLTTEANSPYGGFGLRYDMV
jgi:hypothetical protein